MLSPLEIAIAVILALTAGLAVFSYLFGGWRFGRDHVRLLLGVGHDRLHRQHRPDHAGAHMSQELRTRIEHYLRARDTGGMDMLALAAGLSGVDPDAFVALVEEEMAKLDHDTQEWWGAPCNCEGHLN